MKKIKKRLFNQIKRQMITRNSYHKAYDTLINILIDMLIDLQMNKDTMESDRLSTLKNDIMQYADRLDLLKDIRTIGDNVSQQLKGGDCIE